MTTTTKIRLKKFITKRIGFLVSQTDDMQLLAFLQQTVMKDLDSPTGDNFSETVQDGAVKIRKTG